MEKTSKNTLLSWFTKDNQGLHNKIDTKKALITSIALLSLGMILVSALGFGAIVEIPQVFNIGLMTGGLGILLISIIATSIINKKPNIISS